MFVTITYLPIYSLYIQVCCPPIPINILGKDEVKVDGLGFIPKFPYLRVGSYPLVLHTVEYLSSSPPHHCLFSLFSLFSHFLLGSRLPGLMFCQFYKI